MPKYGLSVRGLAEGGTLKEGDPFGECHKEIGVTHQDISGYLVATYVS